jgi:colanic acid biosynthesis glycosyl transferase WcaI
MIGTEFPRIAGYPDFALEPGRFAHYAGAEILRVPLLPRGSSTVQLGLNYLSFVITARQSVCGRLRGRSFDPILYSRPRR